MFNYILITVILFVVVTQISSYDDFHPCVASECECTDGSSYDCPKDEPLITITIEKPLRMIVDCDRMVESYNVTFLPKLNRPDIKTFHLRNCPVPETSFNQFLLYNFNISKLEQLFIYNLTKELVLTNASFENMPELRRLSVEKCDLSYERDFLAPISDLTMLYLNNNQLHDVSMDFTHTPNLAYLDLSRNELTDWPTGLFRGLKQLKHLYLFSNNITELDEEMFADLGGLNVLELSYNQISSIRNRTFDKLEKLTNVSLQANKLHELPAGLFRSNRDLESVWLGRNLNVKLSDFLLADLKNLKTVILSYSNLTSLSENLFNGDENLEEVFLDHNALETLPSKIFRSATKLKDLSLSGNVLKALPSDVFKQLANLEKLDLSRNNLTEIDDQLFSSLSHLKELALNENSISVIDLNAFQNTHEIVRLNLARNQYTMQYLLEYYDLNPFSELLKLEQLDLSWNLIKTLQNNLIYLYSRLRRLDLSHNRIDAIWAMDFTPSSNDVEVDLSFNNISTFMMRSNLSELLDLSKTKLNIGGNPFRCDCYNYDFVRYLRQDNIRNIEIEASNALECAGPAQLAGQPLKGLNMFSIVCELQHERNTNYTGCAEGCDCYLRSHDKALIIDCSYRNLTKLPKFVVAAFTNQTVLNLMGNAIERIPEYATNWMEYRNVTVLNLNGNRLIDVAWLPPAVQELHLDGNKLTHLRSSIVTQLKSNLARVTLKNNPWTCDCTNLHLQNYLQLNQRVDANAVYCANSTDLILHVKDICPSHLVAYLSVTFTIILVALMLVAAYYRYEQEIKVWLYAKNLLLWLITEEELDKDKQFDVFVSYSHKDEDFVVEKLLPELESGPSPYSVCVHFRNWMPGEFISTQLTRSVMNSRRTLVILSNNFVDSVWGKMEFRTAHTEAIREGRARVIVLIFGDLNEDLLDDELKVYLKTNTYIKWGDPYFWNKLRYALPHRKLMKNQQKLQNIMLKIDKLELKSVGTENHAYSDSEPIKGARDEAAENLN